jgi:lipid II:glycine glycyltransferase (peptidoglycan interpeptide bridge formation enzyme)
MMQVKQIDPDQWASLATTFGDYNYENAPTYAQAIAARAGATAEFVVVGDGQQPVACAFVRVKKPLLPVGGVAYISSGPLVRRLSAASDGSDLWPSVLAALREEYVVRRKLLLIVRPAIEAQAWHDQCAEAFSATGFVTTDISRKYHTVLVDLSLELDKLRSKLSRTWRLRLNQSEKNNLVVETGTSRSHWERFCKVYAQMLILKHFESEVDPDFFNKLDLAAAGVVVMIATHAGRDVGAIVLSVLGDTGVYVFAATDTVGRDKRAGYKLNWEAIRHLKAGGFRWYDLGGVDVDDNEGGYAFKTRIGGDPVQAAGPFKAVPSSATGKLVDGLLTLRYRLRKHPAPSAKSANTE